MTHPAVMSGTMYEGEAPPPTVMRLVADDGATLLKKVDGTLGVDTIELRVYDAYDAEEGLVVTKTLTGSGLNNVMFDTAQTDAYAFDNEGYNFRHQLTAADVAAFKGGHVYVFEYQIQPTAQKNQVHTSQLQVHGTGY